MLGLKTKQNSISLSTDYWRWQ